MRGEKLSFAVIKPPQFLKKVNFNEAPMLLVWNFPTIHSSAVAETRCLILCKIVKEVGLFVFSQHRKVAAWVVIPLCAKQRMNRENTLAIKPCLSCSRIVYTFYRHAVSFV